MEIWKDIAGYEGLYQVSNCGQVRNRKGKVITLFLRGKNKVLYIVLYKNNIKKRISVHRLVAETFIANAENKPLVDHIDRNALNNHASNLRWATRQENDRNRSPVGDRSSKYKGVRRRNKGKPWRVTITLNGVPKNLGSFDCEHNAAMAYNEAATLYFGEYAFLNVITNTDKPNKVV